jgi:putative membrane-bound dehydrogenase-like protein
MRLRGLSLALIYLTIASSCHADPHEGAGLPPPDPYHVGLGSPRLTTPQWVGEPGVEAVVVLAVDDLRNNTPLYEAYLRPILDRLKAIDGRAGLSIMTCEAPPDDPIVGRWLKEGVNLDVHSITHDCPLLRSDNLPEARASVLDCLDRLARIPGNRPVAFRMPCCDSQNTNTPRFYSEIFNRQSRRGRHLAIDSSVFHLFTAADTSLPPELVRDADGRPRFHKYIPFPSYRNTIENYPYPYVIGGLCWEFPCMVPSDWQAQHLQRPNNPRTVDDLNAALDAVVKKQGVFNLVFHPHGWIRSDQIVALIDHAVATHGRKVKFLSFREALERLDKNLLAGHPLRDASGSSSGVRLADLNRDGLLDVIIDLPGGKPEARIWAAHEKRWRPGHVPVALNEDPAPRPGVIHASGVLPPPPPAGDEPLQGVVPRGKSPEESLRSIRVEPGFIVELVAKEPLVADPIAFDWGADGRLWVVEMGDYPRGTDGKGKPGGVVRVLDDADGDGRYDRSTVFLDGLGFPTGLIPWRSGVLVACAPDILYAEDRDGDGKADHREVLFTGFREGNQQHRLNGFELGLDGWVYGANGDSGGLVRSVKTGSRVSINGRDFRFRPDDGRFETESGQTQFGRHRDDWGHWFGDNNPNWAWHYVLAEEDLRRNPQYAPRRTYQMLETDNVLYPASRTLARFNDPHTANRVTSANSPTPYRDDLFGPEFATSLFVSEPVHNLVHRMVLEPAGATFRGHRGAGEADREFLASTDNWTRPTMLKTGPDGALWIADMYRAVIEHPEWIPDDWEARLDLRAGSSEGRIYRVYPKGKKPRPIPRLDRVDTAGLVAALDSPSGWQRDTAQRLLLHRNDPAAAAPLRALAASSQRAATRVQALWTLKTLGALTAEPAIAALGDSHPQVRRNAIKASAELLAKSPALGEAVLARVVDPDAEVRFQLALALGDWPDPRAGRALASLVRRDPEDPWLRSAVLSSAAPHAGTILAALFREAGTGAPPTAILEPLFALAGTSKDRAGLESLAAALEKPAGQGGRFAAWQFAAVASLVDAAARARRPLDEAIRTRLDTLARAARQVAADDRAGDDVRLAAIRLLGRDADRRNNDRALLAGLLRPQVPGPVQQAAVAALGRGADPQLPAALVGNWKAYSPALRSAILDTLLSRDAWASALLFSLEDRCVPPAEIDPTHRRALLAHRNAEIRKRAETVFAVETSGRQEVLTAYREALRTPGDPDAGARLFQKTCATCHRLGNAGVDVGPDLAALTDRSPESLLAAILDPNRAFEAKYANFTVQTTDGRVLTGLVASETATAVTLRRQEGKEDVLLRTEIEAMAGSGQSLMPEGLEKDLKPRDVADLIAYLGTAGPPPKSIAGNRPELVKASADGSVTLRARTAELYGDTLTYEAGHDNLGYWGRPSDRAAWRFEVPRAGRFEVWIEWACDDSVAGNTMVIQVGPQEVRHKVAGTGSWETYRTARVGTLDLAAGAHRLEAHSLGRLKGALLDLRWVELRPAH